MIIGGRLVGLLAVLLIPALFLIDIPPGLGASLGFADAQGAAPFALPPLAAAALFAGLAAWLGRWRRAQWSRIVVDEAQPASAAGVVERKIAPPAARRAPTEGATAISAPGAPPPSLPAPALPAPPEGADLAARARFVAMTFAFPEAGLARPGASDWPLQMRCQPLRFALTLRHAALSYRLEFSNRSAEALGPLIIRADLVAAGSGPAPDDQADFAAEPLPLCHYLDNLQAGDRVELTGELRLPLAGIAAMRLGTAELLVPLMRLCAQSAGESRPALRVATRFAIGMPPLSAGGGIQPFRLDSGPGIWRKLAARQVIDAQLT